jgi:hypothetical protein
MTAQTGKTHAKHIDFRLEDAGGAMRSIPVNSISGIGLTYEELDLTAFQDAIKNSVLGHPEAPIEISGPWTTTAAQTAGTLSGSHTILSALVGVMTPKSLDIQVGVRHAWESGEPQFGISASLTPQNGYVVQSYVFDPSNMTYTARLVMLGGSVAPAWGTAAEVVAA